MSGFLAKLGRHISAMSDQKLFKFAQTMSVVLMPSLLPVLRYQFDEPSQRKKLFVRDFTGGWIGMASYYTARFLVTQAAKVLKIQQKMGLTPGKYGVFVNAISVTAGWLGNIAYQGIGAVKLSQWMDKRFFNAVKPAPSRSPYAVTNPAFRPLTPQQKKALLQYLSARPQMTVTTIAKPY
jgi:hypothetical protein